MALHEYRTGERETEIATIAYELRMIAGELGMASPRMLDEAAENVRNAPNDEERRGAVIEWHRLSALAVDDQGADGHVRYPLLQAARLVLAAVMHLMEDNVEDALDELTDAINFLNGEREPQYAQELDDLSYRLYEFSTGQ